MLCSLHTASHDSWKYERREDSDNDARKKSLHACCAFNSSSINDNFYRYPNGGDFHNSDTVIFYFLYESDSEQQQEIWRQRVR